MSFLNEDLKSIFIHLPKCAGSSMESFDWNLGSGHETIYDFFIKKINIKEYFKWCFVRNPWERILSAYEYHHELYCQIPKFSDFINILYKDRYKFKLPHLKWSNEMPKLNLPIQRIHFFPMNLLIKIENEVCMDFIGKYESLEEDWKKIQKKFNKENCNLSIKNDRRTNLKMKNSNYKDIFNKDLIKMVEEIYQEDIELFNYSFD